MCKSVIRNAGMKQDAMQGYLTCLKVLQADL